MSCCGREVVVEVENCDDDEEEEEDDADEAEVFSLLEVEAAAMVVAAAIFDTTLNKPQEFLPASTVISTLLFFPELLDFMFCDW